jgi:parallel beta-helix repeat protein
LGRRKAFYLADAFYAYMRRKVVAVWVSLLIMVSSIVILVEIAERVEAPITLYVGGAGGGNYTKIQWAIDNASDGDSVFVYSGTYFENVVVDKTINLTGEDRDTTVINGSGIGDVIKITMNWTNITGFTLLEGGNNFGDAALGLSYVQNCTVSNINTSSNNYYGIFVYYSSSNTISNNRIYNCREEGIRLFNADKNDINNNTVSNREYYGISLMWSDENKVIHNNASSNKYKGIIIEDSTKNNIIANNASNNRIGIYHDLSNRNNIVNNYISSNSQRGIYLAHSHRTNITGNTISGNYEGIYVDYSIKNEIINNTISENNENGIYLSYSNNNNISKNRIYSNIVHGIHFHESVNNSIANNTIYSNDNNGIFIYWFSQNNIISQNNIFNNDWGVWLSVSSGNTISKNSIYSNIESSIYFSSSSNNYIINNSIHSNINNHGIYFSSSSGNIISNNSLHSNENDGIYLSSGSNDNTISKNSIHSNDRFGIHLLSCSNNYMIDNLINSNYYCGIYFDGYSDDNTISNNSIYSNNYTSILFWFSSRNMISNNSISSNLGHGISLNSDSNSNMIIYNTITYNSEYGIFINTSDDNRIHHNNILSNNGAPDSHDPSHSYPQGYNNGTNYWNDSSEGNWWSDWKEPDSIPPSGIVDNPYLLDIGGQDYYPLTDLLFQTTPSEPQDPQTVSGGNFVNLTWVPPLNDGGSAIIEYNIYRNGTIGIYDTVNASQLWFNDTNVLNDLIYIYNITAVNIIGEGLHSIDINGTPFMLSIPLTPQFDQDSVGDEYVNLTWTIPANDGNSPILGYYIYRNGTSGFYETLPPGQLWLNDTNVINGITYTYNVSAYNAIGESIISSGISATPKALPSEPTNVQANAADSYIVLMWDPPISDGGFPVLNYSIYRGETQGEETYLIKIGNILSYNDTDVTNGVTYYYRLIAFNDLGEGLSSQIVNATPKKIIIPINQIPTCSISSPITGSTVKGNIEINGTASDSDGEVQKVEIKIDDGNWIQVDGTILWRYSLDTTSYSNGEHTVYVRAYDRTNYSSENQISIQINNPVPEPVEERSIFEELWLWAIIILLIIVILILILLTQRKKDNSETEIEKQEARDEDISAETKSKMPSEDENDDVIDEGEEIIEN